VLTDDDEGRLVYGVSRLREAFEELNTIYRLFDVAVVPADLDWLIFASEHDFFAVLGPRETVEELVGMTSSAAVEKFRADMSDFARTVPSMRAIADAAWESFSELPRGDRMTISFSS
jgi:hypothetical protein